jgi:ABC-2 type transport system ATP-binding protein
MLSIVTKALTKKFGSLKAVDSLDLEVHEGEVFGLLGPNGAGKTTTLRMLACLIAPSHGSASVAGCDIERDPLKVRQAVGILTENPSLYERLTAYENMDFFAEAYDLSDPQERRKRIRELLELFNLWERRNDKVATFSKGMKQKLAIVRAIVHDPPVLFLDEPTSGLDPESAKEIRDLIKSLSQGEKHTILLCTHRLEDAEKLCVRVIIINRGKTVIVGTPEELLEKIGGPPAIQIVLKEITRKITDAVKKLPQVRAVSVDASTSSLIITTVNVRSIAPEIVKEIVNTGGMIFSVNSL